MSQLCDSHHSRGKGNYLHMFLWITYMHTQAHICSLEMCVFRGQCAHIFCNFMLRCTLLSKMCSLSYLLPSVYNKVCHGILSTFPHRATNFSGASSEFAFTLRHFICPALRGIINHIRLLGYLRMFIYVRCFFGKMHYEESIGS